MIAGVIFFLGISLVFVTGIISPILEEVKTTNNLNQSSQSYYSSEANQEDVIYRLKNNLNVGTNESLTVNGVTASSTVSTVSGGKQIIGSGDANGLYRNTAVTLASGNGASFHYGIQSGAGGMNLTDSSFVSGSVYSSGPITGNSNDITGDAVSAGSSGMIDGMIVDGSAYSHTIQNSLILHDAYYQTFSSTVVLGTSHGGSTDQPILPLPIADAQITSWENAAQAGGVINGPCPYTINSNATLGPVKINCDLSIKGANVTLKGPVWVNGNVTVKNSSTISVDSSLGPDSAMIIADNTLDQINSSQITLSNSSQFNGSGNANSYVMLISQNKSAEQGGGVQAISAGNSVSGALILYAGHGEVAVSNSISLNNVTAYKVSLSNSAQVIYQTGLANLIFSSGPGGGYTISSWKETQ